METKPWDGKPITAPGCYSGVPISIYHGQDICAGPSISSSNHRRVLESNKGSPLHFFTEWSGGEDAKRDSKEAPHLALGRAAHHLLLGQERFREHFVTRPSHFDSWLTKAAKIWRTQAQAAGLSVLTEADLEVVVGMAQSIERTTMRRDDDPRKAIVVRDLLAGEMECSFVWQDKDTGLWCKARPDAIPTLGGADFVDLKTAHSVAALDVMRSISEHAYHMQAALILEGARECFGVEIKDCTFTLLFVESKRPFAVRATGFTPEDIAMGLKQNQAARELIARCIEAGRWPGPGGWREVEHFDLLRSYRERVAYELQELDRDADASRRAGPARPKRRAGL